MGLLLRRSLVLSHRSLIRVLRTGRCAHWFARSLSLSLTPELMGKWFFVYKLNASILYHFNPQCRAHENPSGKGISRHSLRARFLKSYIIIIWFHCVILNSNLFIGEMRISLHKSREPLRGFHARDRLPRVAIGRPEGRNTQYSTSTMFEGAMSDSIQSHVFNP